MKTETYPCQGCDIDVTRPVSRGQRPKWCAECRRTRTSRINAIECAHCGAQAMTWPQGRYCSRDCANAAKVKPRIKVEPIDQRSPLRRGYEDGDSDTFFAALVAMADTSGECWVWPRLNRSGYPSVRLGKKEQGLHRIVLEVKHGAPLGSQAAHHTCANAACVNPDHLQPVTHRDNVAEMLARHSYLARIRELESALAEVDPQHPLLMVLAVA